MSASNSASDSKGTILIFYFLFIGYDITIKYGLHLELSSQKMDLEMLGFELKTFRLQTLCFTTELTLVL